MDFALDWSAILEVVMMETLKLEMVAMKHARLNVVGRAKMIRVSRYAVTVFEQLVLRGATMEIK